jgi:hypothetical protein
LSRRVASCYGPIATCNHARFILLGDVGVVVITTCGGLCMHAVLARLRVALILVMVVIVTTGMMAAPRSFAGSPPGGEDRSKVEFAWKFGGPITRADAEKALSGSDADVADFLSTQLKRDVAIDKDVQVNRMMAVAGVATRTAAQQALDAGTEDALTTFLNTGWQQPFDVDLDVRVNQLMAAGGPQVKKAAQQALDDGSEDALQQFLSSGWRAPYAVDESVRVNQEMAAGGPEVQKAAQQALDDGSLDALTQFLDVDLPVAQARDAETADITQLVATVTNAAAQAASETQEAKAASDRAVTEAAAAERAAQAAKAASVSAQGHAAQATDAANRAAAAAAQAAATAREAIGAANAASAAADTAAAAASRAAAAAAAAGRAASNAYGAAAAAVLDEGKAANASHAAQVARDAAHAASTAASAADSAKTASAQAGAAGDAAYDAANRSVSAAQDATDAADNAAAAHGDASEAQAAAARARAEAARSVSAAHASQMWANQSADAANKAAGEARAAASDANAAAAAADDAAAHAGQSTQAAQEATDHANSASSAAKAADVANQQAVQIATAARQSDDNRIALAGQAADDAAKEALTTASTVPVTSRWDLDQASTWDATTTRLVAEANAPGTSRDTVLVDAHRVALTLTIDGGPWTARAASQALGATDNEAVAFITGGLADAAGQDDRTILGDLVSTGTAGFKQAAATALAGSDTAVRDFLRSRNYPGRQNDDDLQTNQIMAAARTAGQTTVVSRGQQALDAGTDEALRDFIDNGQYAAAAIDERIATNQIQASAEAAGSRELAAAAQAALDGPAQLLHQFVTVNQFAAARRDQNTAAHNAAIDSLLQQAAHGAAQADLDADQAQYAAAVARKAAQAATDAANQAKVDSAAADRAASQAQDAANRAAQSAQQAQASANAASHAAATANAAADAAGRSALAAQQSAEQASSYADQASQAAAMAFAASVAAGKSAAEAQAAAKQAWQDVVDKTKTEQQKIVDDRKSACQSRSDSEQLFLNNTDCVLLVTGSDADRNRIFGQMQARCRSMNAGDNDLINRCLDPRNMWSPDFTADPDPAQLTSERLMIGPPGEGEAVKFAEAGVEDLLGLAEKETQALTQAEEASRLASAATAAASSQRLLGEDSSLASEAELLAEAPPCPVGFGPHANVVATEPPEMCFRGSRSGESPNFTPRPNDYKVDPKTGYVKDSHGVSIFDNPISVEGKGFVPNEINMDSVPNTLRIIQRGSDLRHFEIVPAPGANLTPGQYAEELSKITTK